MKVPTSRCRVHADRRLCIRKPQIMEAFGRLPWALSHRHSGSYMVFEAVDDVNEVKRGWRFHELSVTGKVLVPVEAAPDMIFRAELKRGLIRVEVDTPMDQQLHILPDGDEDDTMAKKSKAPGSHVRDPDGLTAQNFIEVLEAVFPPPPGLVNGKVPLTRINRSSVYADDKKVPIHKAVRYRIELKDPTTQENVRLDKNLKPADPGKGHSYGSYVETVLARYKLAGIDPPDYLPDHDLSFDELRSFKIPQAAETIQEDDTDFCDSILADLDGIPTPPNGVKRSNGAFDPDDDIPMPTVLPKSSVTEEDLGAIIVRYMKNDPSARDRHSFPVKVPGVTVKVVRNTSERYFEPRHWRLSMYDDDTVLVVANP